MALIYPDHIDPDDPRRDGERLVFQWLSEDSIRGTAFYSQLQKTHEHKLVSEVDFLYLNERGFLCIEVKGGIVSRVDKSWYSKNKAGVTNDISNPFKQAIGCQNALKRYFKETFGTHSLEYQYLVGYAVIFPECSFHGRADDLVTEVLFDGKNNIDNFTAYLDEVFDYWYDQELKKHERIPPKIGKEQMDKMIDLLRGDFQCVPSMHLEFQTTNKCIHQLTDEQYDSLDIADENSIVAISGVAGTGKSMLAIELARRNAAKNRKVLYLCFNRNMATFAKSSIENNDNIDVYSYHKLLLSVLERPDLYDLSVPDLSQAFLTEMNRECTKYDYVIIDEGQDLLCLQLFDVIDNFVNGGIKKGRLAIFYDPNQNIFNHSEDYDYAIDYLRDVVKATFYPLKTNCRNTEQIARRTSVLTWVPAAKYLKVKGPNVVTKDYIDERDFLKKFKADLMALLSYGVLPKDIVILSKYKKANSIIRNLDSVCNKTINECDDISRFNPNCINYLTIQSYKGLESEYVLLIDIDGFESPVNRRLNYVGMSRAKVRLSLFYDSAISDEYLNVLDKGGDLLL